MCGYCIESSETLSFIESEKIHEQLELINNLVPIYLQESIDLDGIIAKVKGFDIFASSIDIILCRLCEKYINCGYDDSYKLIVSRFDKNFISKYFTKQGASREECIWDKLKNQDLYIDKRFWDKFTQDNKYLMVESHRTLRSYCDWWVSGVNKEYSDPSQRLEETGVMDPIDDTTPEDWDKFYSIFPALYFSLVYLTKHNSKSDIIKCIALNPPHDVPFFDGYDLWLQRKAFATCVKEYGIQFIMDNFDEIRFGLIAYALLKVELNSDDLNKLKDVILSRDHYLDLMKPESVLQLIGRLKHQ